MDVQPVREFEQEDLNTSHRLPLDLNESHISDIFTFEAPKASKIIL